MMTQTDDIVTRIASDAENYHPNDQVCAALRNMNLIGLFGPFCIGKSAIIGNVCDENANYGAVQTFTTRPARHGSFELGRKHINHTTDELAAIHKKVKARSLVQITVHPSTGYLYGTALESYPAESNLLDILPSSLAGFRQLPFQSFRKYYVVSPLNQWKRRIHDTHSRYANELNKRFLEAAQNLEWGLQNQRELIWLVNEDGSLKTVSQTIISGIKPTRPPQRAIQMAHEMYEFAQSQLTE